MSAAIGDYLVSRQLARGASTHTMLVNNAAHTVFGVAKRLSPRFRNDRAARTQFDTEARVLRALAGRGAPKLLATGEDAAGPWLVMEHVARPPLTAWILALPDERSTRAEQATELAFDTLATVHAAADERGPLAVVHGDVHPGNVLVDDGRAVLVDFGLASFRDAAAPRDGAFRGTLRYAAPEVARGEPATPSSDRFSLALALLESASGEPARPPLPFPALVALAGETSVVAYAERAARALPSATRAKLLAAVAFDRNDRP